jgi:hypothetical protein
VKVQRRRPKSIVKLMRCGKIIKILTEFQRAKIGILIKMLPLFIIATMRQFMELNSQKILNSLRSLKI